jgi:hypothetical protein
MRDYNAYIQIKSKGNLECIINLELISINHFLYRIRLP